MRSPVQIYEFIESILNKRGISDRQMLAEAGLKRGVLDNMKKGSMPSADKIAAIAEYLGVSVDTLLETESKHVLKDNHRYRRAVLRGAAKKKPYGLHKMLNKMSDEDLKKMESYAAFLVSESEKKHRMNLMNEIKEEDM